MGNQLAEYIVKLGTQVDNNGFQQVLNLLNSTKMKALGITAAMTAATTAIYKFVEASTKKEFELRKLQKTQQKSIEQLRAQDIALKSMGMTLQEINKDQSLKKIYNDLVKFNKEMEMPNTNKALQNVRELQGAFWRLRSVVNYVVQAIGSKILINMEAPIKRITKGLGNISEWFKKNFEVITSRAAVVLTAFTKGILAVVEGFKKVGELVGKLPAGIKAVGGALIGVIGLLKSGPLGQLLALVTAIGDVIHDYEVYQWNKENGYNRGDKEYVKNLNDIWGIWDVLDGNQTVEEKSSALTEKSSTEQPKPCPTSP